MNNWERLPTKWTRSETKFQVKPERWRIFWKSLLWLVVYSPFSFLKARFVIPSQRFAAITLPMTLFSGVHVTHYITDHISRLCMTNYVTNTFIPWFVCCPIILYIFCASCANIRVDIILFVYCKYKLTMFTIVIDIL